MSVKCPFSCQFRTDFVRAQSAFATADKLLHEFDVFRNSDMQTGRGRPLPFGRSVTPVKLIDSSSRSTLVVSRFFPENSPNKRRELQFFSWCKTLLDAPVAIVFTGVSTFLC